MVGVQVEQAGATNIHLDHVQTWTMRYKGAPPHLHKMMNLKVELDKACIRSQIQNYEELSPLITSIEALYAQLYKSLDVVVRKYGTPSIGRLTEAKEKNQFSLQFDAYFDQLMLMPPTHIYKSMQITLGCTSSIRPFSGLSYACYKMSWTKVPNQYTQKKWMQEFVSKRTSSKSARTPLRIIKHGIISSLRITERRFMRWYFQSRLSLRIFLSS